MGRMIQSNVSLGKGRDDAEANLSHDTEFYFVLFDDAPSHCFRTNGNVPGAGFLESRPKWRRL